MSFQTCSTFYAEHKDILKIVGNQPTFLKISSLCVTEESYKCFEPHEVE